ncbi:MAG TPA: hypothetical protein VJ550_05710 [Geomonas sp.]|nr:hypothetical protein [Geomonas sp.]
MDYEAGVIPSEETTISSYETVALKCGDDQLVAFYSLLQGGVTLRVTVGRTLRELLTGQLGIPADYVTGRITTIFLNNSPLDDLDVVINQGARVSLSAAMPGLVGAVMRRSGFYAALREGITYAELEGGAHPASGTITLKLFNLLLSEVGPLILARGIVLQRPELERLLAKLSALWIASSYPREREVAGDVLLTVTFRDEAGRCRIGGS